MHTNKGSLTNLEKLNYFSLWFGEFSSFQKADFLEVIAKKYNEKIDVDNYNGNLTAGFKKLELNDRLPSIFQCRLKFFDEWFVEWSDDEREQLLERIKNLDSEFWERLDKAIETGKMPPNSLLYCSYELDNETYEQLRKNHQLTNGNSLNSISSIDLLINSSSTNGSLAENGHLNGSLTNGKDDASYSNGNLENGHQTNGHHTNGHRSSSEEETEDQIQQHNLEQEDSIDNQISSLETDNAHNGDTTFNESSELKSDNI